LVGTVDNGSAVLAVVGKSPKTNRKLKT
jgi:hypothetical protein